MPKYFRYTLLFLLFPILAFSQALPVRVNVQTERGARASYTLHVQFKAEQAMQQGVALVFESKVRPFLLNVTIDGKALWLKNAQSVPKQAQLLHWTASDSTIRLMFNPAGILPGAQIDCTLHLAPVRLQSDTLRLKLFALDAASRAQKMLRQVNVQLKNSPQNNQGK